MGIFFRKTKHKIEDINIINEFFKELNTILLKDDYISKKEYKFLLANSDYKKLFDSLVVINEKGLLNSYCKKDRESITIIKKFLDEYLCVEKIIDKRNEKFIADKIKKEKPYLDNILYEIDPKISLDDDQRKVVVSDEDYSLVIAGAGAGKTTTVAAKVKYLVDKKKINPEEILIISFTNKAVDELKERINKGLKIKCPISTFHSLGNTILREKSEVKLGVIEEGYLFNLIANSFKEILKNKSNAKKVLLFFESYFDKKYEGNINKEEYINNLVNTDLSTLKSNLNEYESNYYDIKSKKRITLNKEIVRSFQEVQIANFLYLNNIDYEYEPKYPYHIYMAKKRYTPDFLLKQNGKEIYLEHFGISENGENDLYSKTELERYKKIIRDKLKIHKEHNTKLIYTFSKYNDNLSLLEHLKKLLMDKGFILQPKDPEEVLNKLNSIKENKYTGKMISLICTFISNFKVNGYTEETFYKLERTTKSERTKLFLEICKECYLEYQKTLVKLNSVDFQDMINDAAKALKEIEELKKKLKYKYIIIDEYQDISRQRFDLAKELSKVTNAKIIAVGDDWQSIFAFSGADVSFFTKFKEKMGYARELKITRTYRNAQEVIDIAGGFIQKNSMQIKKELISPKHIINPIVIVSYDDSSKKTDEDATNGGPLYCSAIALEKTLGEIIKKSDANSSILVIGRYNFDGEHLSRTELFEYDKRKHQIRSKKYPSLKIDFLTAHSSKGLGYDNVIIINAKNDTYGFPSKIEDDPVLKLVIKHDNAIDYAEERRLFYVALTRTKNRVYIIAPERHPSEFLLELQKDYKNITLNGELNPIESVDYKTRLCPYCGYPLQRKYKKGCEMTLWVCTNEPEICGFLTNNLHGDKLSILKCSECDDGYLIVKMKDYSPFLGCTNYKQNGTGCNKTISLREFEKIYSNDLTVEVRESTDVSKNIIQIQSSSNIKNNLEVSYDKIIKKDNDYSSNQFKMTYYENSKAYEICKVIFNTYYEMSKKTLYGVKTLSRVLRGGRDKKTLEAGFDNIKWYGHLKDLSNETVILLIEFLIDKGVFHRFDGKYPTIKIVKKIDILSENDFIKIMDIIDNN